MVEQLVLVEKDAIGRDRHTLRDPVEPLSSQLAPLRPQLGGEVGRERAVINGVCETLRASGPSLWVNQLPQESLRGWRNT